MSGLASILLEKGYRVSGSDIADSKALNDLRARGAKVYIGHAAENIEGATIIVNTAAVHADNPEMMAAAKRYILAISQCYSGVAVLFVMRNTLQGLGFTYANSIAGIGELFGRLSVAFILTPLLGFEAVCYAGPAAWILADIPLIIIYLIKQRDFRRLIKNSSEKVAV